MYGSAFLYLWYRGFSSSHVRRGVSVPVVSRFPFLTGNTGALTHVSERVVFSLVRYEPVACEILASLGKQIL